jgi:hypothetical protein
MCWCMTVDDVLTCWCVTTVTTVTTTIFPTACLLWLLCTSLPVIVTENDDCVDGVLMCWSVDVLMCWRRLLMTLHVSVDELICDVWCVDVLMTVLMIVDDDSVDDCVDERVDVYR